MHRRTLALAVAVAISACTAANPSTTPTPAPTREPGSLNVSALLDLSGSRAPSGAPQRDALQLWADQHATGSPRLRLRIVDVAGSPSKTVLELRRAAVEDRADAIVVGVPVDYGEPFAAAVQLAQVPVLFTLPIAEPATAGGWAFALAPTPAQLARATLDHAAARAILSSTIVVSDESVTAIPDRAALVADLSRRGVTANVIKVTASDAGQRLRAIPPLTPIVFFAGTPKTYLDGARQSATGTLLYLSYLSDLGDIAELREAAAQATWPGSRWIATGTSPNQARSAFVQSYTDRAGAPTSLAATAYDALSLLAAAAEGSLEPVRVRERLQAATFPGIATTYSFSMSRRAGFAFDDLALLGYTGARTAPVIR
jgi:ABC-type branched-subunit amino acid transport system substrate-binding protein